MLGVGCSCAQYCADDNCVFLVSVVSFILSTVLVNYILITRRNLSFFFSLNHCFFISNEM